MKHKAEQFELNFKDKTFRNQEYHKDFYNIPIHTEIKNNKLLESMTKLDFTYQTIRIWREEKDFESIKDSRAKLQDFISIRFDEFSYHDSKEISEFILGIERVNAVEILDKQGFGTIYYSSWP